MTGKQRAASLDIRLLEAGQVSYPPSPRAERKHTPHSLYPSTLTVEIPQPFDEEGGGGSRTRPRSPVRAGSPISPLRGISYPPLSPKLLKVSLKTQAMVIYLR